MLGSGSSGNCAFLGTPHMRVLVDAGLSGREIARRLESAGEKLESIDAVLVTHEHSDHIAGLLTLSKRFRIPVHLTAPTAASIDWRECDPVLIRFQAGSRFTLGDIRVDSFTIPHDAAAPVGFCFQAEGVKIGMVTDLGYLPESIKYQLRDTELLVLESNHDLEMLKVGPYPWSVKQRVMSRTGHLSNDLMSNYLLEDFDGRPAELILAHLSEQNNHPEIVRLVADDALRRRALRTRLTIAAQRVPTNVFQF